MKKSIYLFCNIDYGKQFISVFQSFAQQHPDYLCIVVFSIKGSDTNIVRKYKKIISLFFEDSYVLHLGNYLLFHGIFPMMIENVNHSRFVNQIPENTIGFVAGFNQIFGDQIINRFSSLINFHPSLLPFYRGAIPSYWVIKNNEQISGFTAHQITSKIDMGEIIFQEKITVGPGLTEYELDQKIAASGSKYFLDCLNAIINHEPYKQKIVEADYKTKISYIPSKRS